MNIVVCVKYVPEATADRSFTSAGVVDRNGTTGILSELDEYAVEQALRLRDHDQADAASTVVVVTVGPSQAQDALKRALQLGADAGVHVCDPRIVGSDALATARILAAAIGRLPHDVVLFGMASTDSGTSLVQTMVSELLALPALTLAAQIELAPPLITIVRDRDTAVERVQCEMPLVLTVTDQTGEARYPSFKDIVSAKKKKIETLTLEDLGLSSDSVGAEAAFVSLAAAVRQPAKEPGRIVTDIDGSGAAALLEFLTDRSLV